APDDEVLALALSDAQRFAHGPTTAYAAVKTAVRRGYDVSLPEGIGIEAEQFATTFRSEDARIGVAAFIAKEKPEFTGR
ncbi:MAG: enoyl-CoA hydratase/isomerase family protein, partial [Acidimicrobiia bacterium]|nr:enoyl-CoA hydratase/isomerase family protein [Acidimicrobiia bacterium]